MIVFFSICISYQCKVLYARLNELSAYAAVGGETHECFISLFIFIIILTKLGRIIVKHPRTIIWMGHYKK